MKKIAIMQPYLFPYLGYFQLITAVDQFVIYDDAQYIKNGWINRNRILINGASCWLTLPCSNSPITTPIHEVLLFDSERVIAKALKSVEFAYKKAPYFNNVYPLLTNILDTTETKISQIAINGLVSICDYLNINTTLIKSTSISYDRESDMQGKVISICKRLQATHYINMVAGQNLYHKDKFAKNSIQLEFLTAQHTRYKQFQEQIIIGLSIIDVLMFNSPEEILMMCQQPYLSHAL